MAEQEAHIMPLTVIERRPSAEFNARLGCQIERELLVQAYGMDHEHIVMSCPLRPAADINAKTATGEDTPWA